MAQPAGPLFNGEKTDEALANAAQFMPVIPADAGHTVGEDLQPLADRPIADSPLNMPGDELEDEDGPEEEDD